MKTLGNFKMLAVSACIVLGLSSCFKSSDPDFGLATGGWYMLQRNIVTSTDTTPTFAPYILFGANEPIAKASVTSASFPLGVPGKVTSTYYWESNVSSYDYSTSLGNESYTITVSNAEGEKAIFTFQMGANKSEAIGEFDATFTYNSQSGLSVKWKAPENGNYFELLGWNQDVSGNKTVLVRTTKNEIDFTNYNASGFDFTTGKKYGFELVAYYRDSEGVKIKLVNPSGKNQFYVESWGSDNPAE